MAKNFTEHVDQLISGDEGYLPYEKDSERQCPDMCKGYACTRTDGHEGDHAAHGSSGQQYARWEDGE